MNEPGSSHSISALDPLCSEHVELRWRRTARAYGDYSVACRAGSLSTGLAHGPTLAFVHGMVERWDVWHSLTARLGTEVQPCLLELPWSAEQGTVWGMDCEPVTWLDRSTDLLPSRETIVIAHSFGALVALNWILARRNIDVKALVLISPFYKAHHRNFDWPHARYYFDCFDEFVRHSLEVKRSHRSVREDLYGAIVDKIMNQFSPYGWLQFYDLFSRTPRLHLSEISCPTLVIAGDNDISTSPDDCRSLAECIPGAELHVIKGCGHFAMLEQPDVLYAKLRMFLRKRLQMDI